MRKLLLAFAIPCLFAGLAMPDGITSSTSCGISIQIGASQTSQSMNAPTSCSASLAKNSALASVSDILNLPSSGGSLSYVGAGISASTVPDVDYSQPLDTFETATADASVSLQFTFATTGPLRQGFLETDQVLSDVAYDRQGSDSDDFTTAEFSINGVLSPEGCGEFVCADSGPGTLFPITLGRDFVLSEQIEIDTTSTSGYALSDLEEGGQANVDLNFRLVEADGITPVVVYLVPEPNAFGLFTMAMIVLFVTRKYRGGRRS